MIYLHPSLGISNAPSTPPRITDPSYIDRIYEFVGVQKAQFSIVIEASNGTVLDDIKETRLTAHLFDAEGRELTEHLTALSLYWEEHNETWTEVGRGWSYLVNDTSRFLRLFRVRVSQLDIMTALGATIDVETKKTLAGIMVQQEVKITSSSSIYSRIPSADLIHQQLVNDAKFRELVKGDKGDAGKDTAPIRPNLLEGFMGQVVDIDARNSGQNTDNYNYRILIDGKWLEDGKAYIASADFEFVNDKKTQNVSLLIYKKEPPHVLSHTNLNGNTKGRVSIYIPAGVHNAKGIAGYAGYAGETRGVAARYSNIKLEEVQEGESKESTTYLPHLNDLKGKSVTAQEVVSAINTASFRGSISDALKGDATFVAATKGEKGERGVQGVQGKPGAPGAKGEPGKSVTPQEVADTINTAAWQNQIASAAASNIIQTPTLSDKIRKLVQPDTTELIKRHSSRTMSHDILSKNGDKYRIIVPAFALFEPEVEDGAAVSLHVSIRQPIGSCTTPDNHDERGYFFVVESWEAIYTTSAEKLCNKRGQVKVYYDSEQCAESLLSIKLERSNDHWIFVNYYDFAASIQADCTQIVPQSHYSNKSQDEMLSYAPLQYLSGRKRNAVLPKGRVGIVIRVWANKWVGDVRVRTELGESLYNTSDSTGGNIGSDGALIPAGHIGEFICINEEKIWLYTDLSR